MIEDAMLGLSLASYGTTLALELRTGSAEGSGERVIGALASHLPIVQALLAHVAEEDTRFERAPLPSHNRGRRRLRGVFRSARRAR